MTEIKNELAQAFALISAIRVSHDDVDIMAMAREHMRKAFELIKAAEGPAHEDMTTEGAEQDA